MAKEEKVKKELLNEISVVGDSRLTLKGFNQVYSVNPDDLVGRKGLQIYDKMLLDDQIIAIQSLKKKAVLQAGWEIQPASEEPLDLETAEFVESNFIEMQGTVEDKIREILSGKDYGYSISELVYSIIEEGDFSGKIGLENIKTRKPHSFKFDTDVHGNLKDDGLIQYSLLGKENRFSPDKFVIFVNNSQFGNWYGESDLRPAYKNYWSKDNHIKWWNIYGERFAIPITKAKYEKDVPKTLQDRLKEIVGKIQAKMAVLLGPGTDITFEQVASGGERYFNVTLRYHDAGIAKALLMPQLLGVASEQKQGSFAQAKTQFNLFLLVLEDIKKQIEETIMLEQVIRRLVDFNYIVDAYPSFKFFPLTKEDVFEIAKTWVEALKGQAVVSELKDENKVREMLGFEEREETEIEEPEKVEPEEEEEPEVELFRQPDEVEGKVNFGQISRNFDKLESKTQDNLVELFTKQKGKLIDLVKRKFEKNALTTKFINDELNLKFLRKIQQAFGEFLKTGVLLGEEDLDKEVGGTKFDITDFTPTQALKFLEDKKFWITGVIKDDILNDVKSVLLEGMKTGATLQTMMDGISEVYKPFIGDPSAITPKGFPTSPWRLETIVRTNLSEAYNEGRRIMADTPELDDFVIGWEYSEILDSRTAPISIFMDGKKIKKDDPMLPRMTYPLHYNDRGLFVPVTTDDLPVTWMTDGQKNRAIQMIGKFKKG
jgi:phage gp29-like protein